MNKSFLIKKIGQFLKKLFLKIRRRLKLIFFRFKHRILFFFKIKPFVCHQDHDFGLAQRFRPKIKQILDVFVAKNFASDWLENRDKLVELCRKIICGNILIFNDQFLPIKNFDYLWFQTCKNQNCRGCPLDFEKNIFCWDLFAAWTKKVNAGDENNPDIRIAWEFSRLQFLIPLAFAEFYGLGSPQATDFVKKVIESWIEKNPFLSGPNWTSAMEAAIRASNLIWIVCLMDLGQELSSKIVQQLCLHTTFIEDCFEDFDRPNNHVLADLVGLSYLQAFFGNENALKETLLQFSHQIDHQILSDGSSYEGSTGYHRLVCEMFLHALALSDVFGCQSLKKLDEKKDKIFKFFLSSHDDRGQMIHIGDLDSSKFVFGLQAKQTFKKKLEIEYFQDFGVTFFKRENLFATFKLPAGNKAQPTGHFHLDWLSLTLQICGIDIFIDSGSGFYSKDRRVRDYFRSFKAHSTIFAQNFGEEVLAKSGQFCLDSFVDAQSFEKGGSWASAIYRKENFEIARRVEVAKSEKPGGFKIIILDKVSGDPQTDFVSHFILAPNLVVERIDLYNWNLCFQDKKFRLKTDLNFNLENIEFSRGYGLIEQTYRLFCQIKGPFDSKLELEGPL